MTPEAQSLIEVFVLCYNRKEFVAESVRSVLAQTYRPLRLILSDNSTTDDVSDFLKHEFPDLETRRRKPSLANYDHLNQVLGEASGKYLMIFHDDDILEPNYVSDLITELEKTGASAACANAYLMIDGQKTKRLFNSSLKQDLLLSEQKMLAKNYLDYSRGVNPLSGYIYRRNAIQGLKFETKEAGQYSDVTFLIKVAGTGPVFWRATPSMVYRKHASNVSGNISFSAVKRLIHFLVSTGIYAQSAPELKLFRLWNHLFSIRNRKRKGLSMRRSQTLPTALYFLIHPLPMIRKVIQKFR